VLQRQKERWVALVALPKHRRGQHNRIGNENRVRIMMEPSAAPAPVVEGTNKRVRSSSTVFATNSPEETD
jgi:hypothetical protein